MAADGNRGTTPTDTSAMVRATDKPVRPGFETALCVAGSFLVVFLPALGTLAMVYGAWLLSRPQEGRGLQAVLACLVPAVVLCLVSWDALGSLVVPYAPCALVIARVLPDRATITSFSIVVLVLAAALFGLDAAYMASHGSNIVSQTEDVIETAKSMTLSSTAGVASTVETRALVDEVYDLMRKIWPVIYVMRAAVIVGFGFLGLAIARSVTVREAYEAFKRFDMPLWGVVGLLIAIVCLVMTTLGVAKQVPFDSIGLCLFVCLRPLFFLQGTAVVLSKVEQRGVGFFGRAAAVVGLIIAELWLYAGCVLGLIDVWANFRSLNRSNQRVRDEVGK